MKAVVVWLSLLLILSCQNLKESNRNFALLSNKEAWLHHPVLGDPSFDNFKRYEKNPIQRGAPPLEWPVNGFYFEDPKSGNEYLYIGQYRKNYAISNADTALNISSGCQLYCSTNHGQSWHKKGAIFTDRRTILEGENQPITFAPDVSVVYHHGLYYLGCDYVTEGFSWSGDHLKHSGVAVAVSDSPEGPFHFVYKPVVTTAQFYDHPLQGKYNRCYAATLLKTKQGWIMLFMLDSGSHFSWALAAVTAPEVEGPWSEPVLINSTENDGFYPSLLEYFPAFQHNDTLYAPATSVALNRNFQAIFSVPAEKAMLPDQWKLWKEGSLWHSENLENESTGIWGQTFSGFIDEEGQFKIMYPCRDSQGNGTINLASTSWDNPDKTHGFVLSGQNGASYTQLPGFYTDPEIDLTFSFNGTIALVTNNLAPLGPNTPKADATLHPLMQSRQNRFQLTGNHWLLLHASPTGETDTLGSGSFVKKELTHLKMSHHGSETIFSLNGIFVWRGRMETTPGHTGLMAFAHSRIEVQEFLQHGKKEAGHTDWLFTEGLLNAGNDLKEWNLLKNHPNFIYGTGATSLTDTARIKWSFKGSGFDLFLPKLPELGVVQIILNGKLLKEIDLHADPAQKSGPVFSGRNLPDDYNALVVKGVKGKIAVDCLRVYD